ncbi:DUF1793-domain-containing protein [Auricularia subglabra TFB-10046 SS5]|nr:DUF1793-domain-containing protein [Auricularia subglabra TFB-10046 SS5]
MLAAALLPFFTLASLVSAAPSWTSSPLEPAAIPLAVRTPYLSAWLAGEHELSNTWPTFWTGSIVGWAGFARVDGVPYRTMGNAAIAGAEKAVQQSVKIAASTTEFILQAGGVDIIYTFLSPVEPEDLARQSLPFSYMSISARSADGAEHQVEVYADISAEWVSGDNGKTVNWSLERSQDGRILAHKVQLANEEKFAEVNDRIEHGSAYFATTSSASLTFAQGADTPTREMFVKSGRLDGSLNADARPINKDWPVFAFASTLGAVSSSSISVPVVFTLGHVRDPIVQYVVRGGVQERAPFWMTKWSTPIDAITFFLQDYDRALVAAAGVDDSIQKHGATTGDHYVSLLRLSLRQALAAVEITVSRKSDGSLDASDILVFMKEISSNGNMNTVDVIFPFWPLALYTNPELGKHLIEPHFRYQAAGLYPNHFAVHDLGAHYPNATGHNDGLDEAMPLEECGNMLIMALSYAQRSGDNSQLKQYFTLLDGWATYLLQNALVPASQISTDDFAGPLGNQTNLAVKGIIGIAAMGEIAKLTGNMDKATRYTSLAKDMVTRWRALATSTDRSHLKLSYSDNASWGLVYNLYADKLLGLDLFPKDVYDMQTAWYKQQMSSYGIPLDTRHAWTKTDWEIWTAAVSDTELRSALVDAVYRYASNAGANAGAPLGDLYESDKGTTTMFRARPVVGGHFAILALQHDTLGTSAGGGSGNGNSNDSGGSDSGDGGYNGIDDDDLNSSPRAASLSRSFVLGFGCALAFLLF